jgi:hypothetical protein
MISIGGLRLLSGGLSSLPDRRVFDSASESDSRIGAGMECDQAGVGSDVA